MKGGQCSVSGCGKAPRTMGWCQAHYRRWKVHGDVCADRPVEPRNTNILARYTVDAETGCWIWSGPLNGHGYGHMSRSLHGTRTAHRAFYAEHRGQIPVGLHIDHLCRTRSCVNPWHLDAVEPGENTRRGLRSYAIRTTCRSGRHDITKPDAWVIPNKRVGNRTCRACYQECERTKRSRQRATAKLVNNGGEPK